MRIIAFGDLHLEPNKAAAIPNITSADLLLVTGDLTNFGGRTEAARMVSVLRAVNPRLLALAGNLDRPEVQEYLETESISLHGRGYLYGDTGIFGVGGSNPTPFRTPNEFSETELSALLEQGFSQVTGASRHILVSHAPPAGTATDRLASNTHVGSRAVRAFIEQYQPDLCLTGHIHEARGSDHIGRTLIINPGMLCRGGWIEVLATAGAITAQLHIPG
ncbi:MAG: metallophosphoesterase [Desulfobulbaceae bacterium]|nr:metallophosphoesterase [Desulfobulbaceae bacterium]